MQGTGPLETHTPTCCEPGHLLKRDAPPPSTQGGFVLGIDQLLLSEGPDNFMPAVCHLGSSGITIVRTLPASKQSYRAIRHNQHGSPSSNSEKSAVGAFSGPVGCKRVSPPAPSLDSAARAYPSLPHSLSLSLPSPKAGRGVGNKSPGSLPKDADNDVPTFRMCLE